MQQAEESLKLALDCMGGDGAPDIVLAGAELFLKDASIASSSSAMNQSFAYISKGRVDFLLFGDEKILSEKIKLYPLVEKYSTIYHTDAAISAELKPSAALRMGRDSSMGLAVAAVKDGLADAAISAGNTGALMALAKFVLRTLPGINRPAMIGIFPTKKGGCAMLDMGASTECDEMVLYQFAIMGRAFAQICLGIEKPKIGILNIGEEEGKGKGILQNTSNMLKMSDFSDDFLGFVESSTIIEGGVDVVVTDGFSGNIAIKSAEAIGRMFKDSLKRAFTGSIFAKIGYLLAKRQIAKIFRVFDPRLYNGAMFLGLNGVVVKSHGGADAKGFCNAICVAQTLAKNKINNKIIEYFSEDSENKKSG